MKKENKKMAQERRAAERKKQERMQVVKYTIAVVVVLAFFGGMIAFGVMESKRDDSGDANTNTATDTQTTLEQQDDKMDTDTNRKVENGDTVAVHYQGTVDGIPFAGGTGDYDLLIGSHSFIDDFEEQLIGHNIGETVEVNVTFPEGYGGTYQDAEGEEHSLSNVDATFMVDIKGIY